MNVLPFSGDARLRVARVAGARWFEDFRLWRPSDTDDLTTGDVETAVIVLSGTFDLAAGGTTWPARGARASPLAGRPMALFLPRQTRFHAARGSGELLLIAARQPEPGTAATGRDLLSQKPLLPLAGSGKAFDPTSGAWLPAETFPTSPESLPPRRFERLSAGASTVERIFGSDYKAATLCIDEVIVPTDCALRLADVPARPRAHEIALFVRCAGPAVIEHGTDRAEVNGDAVIVLPSAAAATTSGDATIRASAPVYCVVAYAGKG
jgi:hypothetical protein